MHVKYLLSVCLMVLIPYMANTNESQESSIPIETLIEIIQSPNSPDSLKISAFLDMAWTLKSSDPQKALDYAQSGIDLAQTHELPLSVARGLNIMGVVYRQVSNFSVALDYQLEAFSIYQRLQNPIGLARTLGYIGLIYSNQGHYEKALENLFQAVGIFEENGSINGLAPILNNIGRVYQYLGDYALSETFHLRSLNIKKQLNDTKGIAYSLNNLGSISQDAGNYDLALEYYKQALAIRDTLPDVREIASSLTEIGYLHFLMNNLNLSLDYLLKGMAMYQEIDDPSGMAKTYNYLGQVHLRKGNHAQAQQLLEKSLEISQSIGLSRIVLENYKAISELMLLRNNYRMAYDFQKRFISLRDSISSHESQRRMSEVQMLYERERKEKEIELLKVNNKISTLNFEKQRSQTNFLLAGVILILGVLFLLYNRFLALNIANKKLEKQKSEISETNQKLLMLNKSLMEQKQKVEELNQKLNETNQKLIESEKHLIDTNRTKDKFFSIISHDLRNPFASIVSFSRILKREIQELSKDELRELALELDKSVLKINNLLENLLQWSRAQTGKIKYNPEYIALNDVVRENLNLFEGNTREKNIEISDGIEEDLVVYADMNMTNTIIRNLVSNALKYTQIGGRIELSSQIRSGMVYISVADNGVGISAENIAKLFRVDTLHTTFGTSDEKGSGLGLLLCKEFVEKQGGEISLQSTEGEGTVFTFSLPMENPF